MTQPLGSAFPSSRLVALWLLAGAATIYAMVVIGGITRLTESGLSIVEWQPLRGALPPFTDADWHAEFQKYQRTPHYRQINRGMSLADFKSIFWWEFIHRLWGRMIGLVFAVPMLIFWWRGAFDGALMRRLVLLFMLGGAQGGIGWWMVTSGLKDDPLVSPYRLALHLGMALLIYGITLWTAFGLLHPRMKTTVTPKDRAALFLLAAVSMTILAGAFVAGLDAGKIYNEFPFMGAGLVPPDYWHPALPVLRNFFENHAAVQFHHRLLAMGTFAISVGFAVMLWQTPSLRRWALTLVGALALQVMLGILTLLHQAPIGLGAAHQAGAVLVFSIVLLIMHRLRRDPPPASGPSPPLP